jgi:hypothetical protein
MTEVKKFSLIKPTLDTPLHIDFDWWQRNDNNWHIYLMGYLCSDHQSFFMNNNVNDRFIDWVDNETAEVESVDGLQHILMGHCAKQPGFINTNTTLVDAVFRTFLANGNKPMSSRELSEHINRPPDTILRTLVGPTVYKGLRLYQE